MATATTQVKWEKFLAIPEDGFERMLIEGELREKPMTKRNRFHCRTMASLTYFLESWLRGQPEPRGELYVGEVGCLLSQDPDTGFGIDLAYLSADRLAEMPAKGTMLEGPPTLAIEILSPSNSIENVEEKTRVYREYGVKLVWVVNPYSKIVIAYRPKGPPEFFHVENELTATGVLPGFKVPVAELFS